MSRVAAGAVPLLERTAASDHRRRGRGGVARIEREPDTRCATVAGERGPPHVEPERNAQHDLPFRRRGGPRPGAGRPRLADRPRVPHRPRPALAARHPALVTVRVRHGLPSLRGARSCRVLGRCLAAAADRMGMRVVEHSIQSNHFHLIVEAEDERALARGMKGLLVRAARGLNAL